MSRQVSELEAVLQQLIAEHRKLQTYLDAHLEAMKRMDVRAMDESAVLQEASRIRIVMLEKQRRLLAAQLGNLLKLGANPTISKIAAAFPARGPQLMKLRTDLKQAMQAAQSGAVVASRVAGAVLGHLNTALRLFAGAVEKAGVYTKQGVPKVSARIGVMEAVG